MVAEGHDIGPTAQQFLMNVLADAKAVGRVLAIYDDNVGRVALRKRGSSRATASRPVLPTTSPRKINRI